MRRKLDALVGLCEIPSCRRQSLLAYFGQALSEPCGNCDNCLEPPATTDGTVMAQKALSAAYRTGERYGVSYLVDVLTGGKDERIVRNGHDRLSVFKIGTELDGSGWRALYRQLVACGALTGDPEGHGTLSLTERARPILRGEEKFLMRLVAVKSAATKAPRAKKGQPAIAIPAADEPLYAALKALRLRLSAEAKVPPYVICHDRTLIELAAKRPRTEAELGDITGLGASKVRRYGKSLLATIANFAPHPLLTNKLSATVNQTLALHLRGLDTDGIAKERGLDVETVWGHFAETIEAGLRAARAVLGHADEAVDEILDVFERLQPLDTGKLGPAHAALDRRYDYGQLKCLLAELG
jgi:ATP-dependent DNA helicase RecQ